MKVITAPEAYEKQKDDIFVFLAGGITNCSEWQDKVIKELEDCVDTDHLIIFNPRRKNFPIGDKTAAVYQIQWEYEAIELCDIFSMYFDEGDSDQPICMYELGRNLVRMQQKFPASWMNRVLVTVNPKYKRYADVYHQLALETESKLKLNTDLDYHSHFIKQAYHNLFYHRG